MDAGRLAILFLILSFAVSCSSQSVIRLIPMENHPISGNLRIRSDDNLYCDSWKLSVDTNDAGAWSQIPSRCEGFVKEYMTGDRCRSDSEVIADYSLSFAKTVKIAGDGKDAWVFDVDETLLSNLPYYVAHGFGSEIFDAKTFDEWVDLAEAPALPASLRLYTELELLGFKIFVLTGRDEYQRNVTDKNLQFAGYSNYERLILRELSDSGKPAIVYKSERRKGIEDEGYRIHGSSGDQWSDLMGFAMAKRSFKLPNPMYYIA